MTVEGGESGSKITDSLAALARQFLARRDVLKDRSNFFGAQIAVAILLYW
ncbi:MAG: hypothetical protein JGK17_22230 [Microcoleus sp. PH2017_10_PVI_O_A]|nr:MULTISPECIES: hypothetical protein [unclassified Microcoleus]MCC3408256.1 hypothetical protein [Microcoleus sp. PH2017_10_PVI_O_A]MCC3461652.1 hypothetical protein [Microcoleus sp. PH2017_11_PCY_U_A]MCC3480830.1 hypothetical protein [Microcoleus sp. PH2017_12_PCY_D_A]MCC3528951.1 hypothetical protein [Microcoleus sp. PH2017_21_RUC_O_A]MCC3541129.1 hypothetical protein [Microcoleus sp. PH2017_22_RUC_O_B]